MQNRRKKILFISSWYPTRLKPTNGDFVQRHAKAISHFDDIVIIHVAYDSSMNKYKEIVIADENGIAEIILYFKLPKLFFFLKPFCFCFHYFSIYKFILNRFGKPEIIHGNILYPIGFIVLLFKFIFKIPYVFTEHATVYLPESNSRFSFWQKSLIKMTAKYANAVLPVSSILQKGMENNGIKGNYICVNNVVDTFQFKPSKNKIQTRNILHVSSLNENQKNVIGILQAIKNVSKYRNDFTLHIVSENTNNNLLRFMKDQNIESLVEFHGFKSQSELAEMMRNSAFLILFSNYETFSCVAAEAMAAGIPVLSTDVIGIKDHITSDKGILIKSGDSKSLEESIVYLLDKYLNYNTEALHIYAKNEFDYMVVGKAIHDIYSTIQ